MRCDVQPSPPGTEGACRAQDLFISVAGGAGVVGSLGLQRRSRPDHPNSPLPPRAPRPPPPQATQAPGASPGSPAAPNRGEIKAMREFKMLDFNGDGKLSRAEVRLFPRLAAAFDEAYTDHDGYVSYAEVRAFAAKYRARQERERAAAGPAALPKAPPRIFSRAGCACAPRRNGPARARSRP